MLKMGESLESVKSYICSFFDCKAKFTKLWKLEAHLCKHTGLVSDTPHKTFWCDSVLIVGGVFSPRNRSPAKAATRLSATAMRLPGTSSTTVARSATSKNLLLLFYWNKDLRCFVLFIFVPKGARQTAAVKCFCETPAWKITSLECTSTRRDDIK